MPRYTAFGVYFSPPSMRTKLKLRLPSPQPSEPQRSRSRFLWHNEPKQATQNTVVKKRAGQEDVDSDYLFVDAKREMPECSIPPITRHNPHSGRLSLFVFLRKSLVINLLHPICKLNYKEESVRKSHRVSETQSAKAEFSTVLRPIFRSFSESSEGKWIARVQPGWRRGKGTVSCPSACLLPLFGRDKFRMDTRPPCLRRIPGWVQRSPSR